MADHYALIPESPPPSTHTLEPLAPGPTWQRARKLFGNLLGRRQPSAERPTAPDPRPAPRHVFLHSCLSDGQRVQLQGMLLDAPLPRPDDVTAVSAFFARKEPDQGLLELYSEGTESPLAAFPLAIEKGGLLKVRGLIQPALPPGIYLMRWRNRDGVLTEGEGRLRVLPVDYAGPILTSDVDQTWLESNIHSGRGMLELLRQAAYQKHPLPGIVAVYQRLQRRMDEGIPFVLLSASPTFFAPVFSARLDLDLLRADAILLKPFESVLREEYLRTNQVKRAISALKEQLSYKLKALFDQRILYPRQAMEYLFGDDTEYDAITFSLYREVLQHRLTPDALADRALTHGVEWHRLDGLLESARLALQHQASIAPEIRIFIRQHGKSLVDGTLPDIHYHPDSIGLAHALVDYGMLDTQELPAISRAQKLEETRKLL